MIREAFKLKPEPFHHLPPKIVRTDITDAHGLDWRTAKKQLRQWYLTQAKSLRAVTKQQYFGEHA